MRSPSPILVGVVGRMPKTDEPEGGAFGLSDTLEPLRFALDEAVAQGRIHLPVKVVAMGPEGGAMGGNMSAAATAWQHLADMGALAIFGPGLTDTAIALRPTVEAGKVPTISWCGTELWPGEYCFAVPFGGLQDEPPLMVNWLAKEGVSKLAVTRERLLLADEYYRYLRAATERVGIRIVADLALSPTYPLERCKQLLAEARDSGAEALVHLGAWVGPQMNEALAAIGWSPPRITTAAFTQVWGSDRWRQALEGWVGVDLFDEKNTVGQAFLDRYERQHGRRPAHVFATMAYDAGQAIAEGIARAPILTPEGVKEGLERVQMLPAASGGPRTVISFHKWDRRAYKGDYLLLRRVRNGKNEFVSYFEP